MIFNSIEFGIFFPLAFLLYWLFFKDNIKLRNLYLIAISYLFYGWWDWRFLSLIIVSSLVDFLVGQKLGTSDDGKTRKRLLFLSIAVNIGFLAFFKYFNFFVDSFVGAFTLFGTAPNISTLSIILPVGISFYTFQTLSYTIDVYYKKMEPTNDAIGFFAFVSFFPQLVAGPIERAKHLLPQFSEKKTLNYEMLRSGLLLMAWGFFKKIVIADRLARFVDGSYGSLETSSGLPSFFAMIFFAFQLYIDFSAYTDIAIGGARTLGFNLNLNFNHPYLSSSFSNFWKRWHISLSSWFQDYLYIPLGGSRNGSFATKRNILIVFLLSGLWHGASWNFVIWGALNGLFLVVFDRLLAKVSKIDPKHIFTSLFIFFAWAVSLIFFRAKGFDQAMQMFGNLGFSNIESLYEFGLGESEFKFTIFLLIGLMTFEIVEEKSKNLYEWFVSKHFLLRWLLYLALAVSIILFGSYGMGLNDSNFIYFQF
ncbi:MAG: alginate O-acetyltransferase complex protein AlgI [Chitinophagales bacterium]|jgi:alginate O-acetyltransferase complex protein AlgI